MSGETDLQRLVASMRPELLPGVFVFATAERLAPGVAAEAMMTFREAEGVTAILPEAVARAHGLAHVYRCRCITLSIHSSLEAVGFLAAVTGALARAGIGVNPVSAYYHDHLFVAEDRAGEVVAILERLAAGEGG